MNPRARPELRCLPLAGVFLCGLATVFVGVQPSLYAQVAKSKDLKLPFNLRWGESAERIEKALSAAKARVTQRRAVRGGKEAWDIEGIAADQMPGLKKSVFSFKQGSLVGIELQYADEKWPDDQYGEMMSEFRKRINDRYGEGQLLARKTEELGEIRQTIVGHRWQVGYTSLKLVYFSAVDKKHALRTVSLHYTSEGF
jgi:hypothetical protein